MTAKKWQTHVTVVLIDCLVNDNDMFVAFYHPIAAGGSG